jgi:hypothetical protein
MDRWIVRNNVLVQNPVASFSTRSVSRLHNKEPLRLRVVVVVENWLVTKWGVAMAEARRQFGNPGEGELPPLDAVTRRLVRTLTENSDL